MGSTTVGVGLVLLILLPLLPSAETTGVRLYTSKAAHVSCVYMCAGCTYTYMCRSEDNLMCHLVPPDPFFSLLLVCQSLSRRKWLPSEPRALSASLCPSITKTLGTSRHIWAFYLWAQVVMLVQNTLYQLSHFPSCSLNKLNILFVH